MKRIYDYEIGDPVKDLLAGYYCIVRGIEKGIIKLSRVERPDVWYYQTPRYIERLC
jgi:hypothetical protein